MNIFEIICGAILVLVALAIIVVFGVVQAGGMDAVLEHADLTVRIGYSDRHGFRGSLPSAASAAVLAFEVMRQNR